jgi:protocatechuate 3,4-dioxygenase beta subunit
MTRGRDEHSRTAPSATDLTRRRILALGTLILADRVLAACGSSDAETGAIGGAGGEQDASTATDGLADSTSPACVADDAGIAADGSTAWATGGTAAMVDKAAYPNPFATGCGLPSSCLVTCELTQGPCYSSQSVEIQDISYGYTGLPMRMYFRVLDEACNPVAGAVIDVWHVSPVGKYSGDDTVQENIAFCTGNDSDFTSHLYFRGKQTTDATGVAYFDTCFPGWYSSRTIHVHLTISVGGDAYVTTQLGFADALDDSIIATQPVYKDRGARDTTNTTDTVLPAAEIDAYLFSTARMSDGAMLAWKTIVLRASTSEAICGAGGDAGGGPGGGPPAGDGGFGPPPEGGTMPPPLDDAD